MTRPIEPDWIQFTPWIIGLYIAGVAVMLARLSIGIWRAQRLCSGAQAIDSGPLVDKLRFLARQWSLRVVPSLARAERVVVPKVLGLLRPTILFPAGAIAGMSPDQLEMILIHELAHVKRYDMWVNLIQRLAEAILFFNPALWYLSRRISTLREYCCDELTCRAMSPSDEEPRVKYAWALLRVVELARSQAFKGRDGRSLETSDIAALAASGRSPSELRRRVSRLFGEPLREPLRLSRSGIAMVVVLFMAGSLPMLAQVASESGGRQSPATASTQTDAKADAPRPAAAAAKADEPREYSVPTKVFGRAVDAAGRPVASATVYLVSTNGVNRPLGQATTDADGQYELPNAAVPMRTSPDVQPHGTIQIFGTAKDYAFAWHGMRSIIDADLPETNQPIPRREGDALYRKDEKRMDLKFEKAAALSGEVVDEFGLPVVGATLRIRGCDYLDTANRESHKNFREFWAISQAPASIFTVKTDEHGAFKFDGLPPETASWIHLEHPEYARMTFYAGTTTRPITQWDAHPLLTGKLKRTLVAPKTVVFRVTAGAEGRPLADTFVGAYQMRASGTGAGGKTDQEGRITLRLPPGEYKLNVDPPTRDDNTFVRTNRPLVVAADDKAKQVDFRVDDGCVLILSAVDADTLEPVPGVSFWYEREPGIRMGVQANTWQVTGAETDKNGKFRAVVYPGERKYGVGWNEIPEGYELTAANEKTLKLPAGETVNTQFLLRKKQNNAAAAKDSLGETKVAQLKSPSAPDPAATPAASAIEQPRRQSTTLSGRIVLEDGSPATVKGMLRYESTITTGSQSTNSTSGNAGRFADRFSFEVPPGTVWLLHSADGFAPAWVGPLEIKAGEHRGDVTLVLKTGFSTPVRVVNRLGQPVAGAKLLALIKADGMYVSPHVSGTTDANGEHVFTHLADTKYTFNVEAPGFETLRTEPMEVQPDQPISLTLKPTLPVSGIVLNADGTPAAGSKFYGVHEILANGYNVGLIGGPGYGRDWTTADEAGHFTVDQLSSTSRYLFVVETADKARKLVRDLPPGQQDLRIEVPKRRDLKVRIVGDLTPLQKRRGRPWIEVRQHVPVLTGENPHHTSLIGVDVPVTPTAEGAEADYHGLVEGKVEITLGVERKIIDVAENGFTTAEFRLEEKAAVPQPAVPLPAFSQPANVRPTASTPDVNGNYTFPVTVTGRALDEDGKPIAGADVYLASQRPGYKRLAETESGADGTYRFENVALPIQKPDANDGQDKGFFEVFGTAPGYALAWRPKKAFYPDRKEVRDSWGNPINDQPPGFGWGDPIVLDLKFGAPQRIRGRIVDELLQPIAGVQLAIRYCDIEWEKAEYNSFSWIGALDSFNAQAIVPRSVKIRTTGADGRFEFTGLPADYRWEIDVRPPGHPPRKIWAVTHDGAPPERGGVRVYSGDFEVLFPTPRQVKIRVVYDDTGEPAAKVGVGGGVATAGFWETTDESGMIEVPLPDGEYKLSMSPRYRSPYLRSEGEVVVSAATAKQIHTLRLRPAAVVDITVIDAETGKPMEGADVWLSVQSSNSDQIGRKVHGYRSWEVETRVSHYEEPRSDANGKMRVNFEPGKHRIGVGHEAFPQGYSAVDADGKEIDAQPGKPVAVEFKLRRAASR